MLKTPERKLEANRRYAAKNRSKISAQQLEYAKRKREAMTPEERSADKAKKREYVAAWRDANRDAMNAKASAARREKRRTDAAFRAAEIAASKAYQAKHHEELSARRRKKWPEIRDGSNANRLRHHHAHKVEANHKRRRNYRVQKTAYPWQMLLRGARQRAAKRGLEFTLTDAWAAERWTGLCEVSGISFVLKFPGAPGPKFFSASLDQIKAKAGYTPDNCRFVIWAVNALKHDGTDEDMIRVAHAIAANFPLKTVY